MTGTGFDMIDVVVEPFDFALVVAHHVVCTVAFCYSYLERFGLGCDIFASLWIEPGLIT